MKKYWSIFRITFANTTVYRFGLVFDTFQSFLTPIFILLALSYARPTSIPISSLWPYYLTISLMAPIVQPKVHDQFFELERSGEAANFFVKPISLYKYLLSLWASRKVSNLLALLPLLILVVVNFHRHFSPLSIVVVPLSFILYFNLSYLCGLLCFWLEEFWAISNLFEVVLMVLAGVLLPYQFFPAVFNKLILFTPFPYTLNWFARTTFSAPGAGEYGVSLVWIGITFVLAVLLQQKAVKHLSVVGG